jgi:hypothetical protein
MSRNVVTVPRLFVGLLTLYFSLAAVGCGGGSYSSTTPQPSPGPSVVSSVQGSWEIQFHSAGSSNDYAVLEVNLTQAGTKVFAGATSALVYEGAPPNINPPN